MSSLQLEELNIRNNDVSEGLNPAIGRLRTLKKLDLQSCKLKSIPDSFGNLEAVCKFCTDIIFPKNCSRQFRIGMQALLCNS